jgi:predicted amidophosphoribosyltransferase
VQEVDAVTEPAPMEAVPTGGFPARAAGYCAYCGHPHEKGAHFCEECGFHFPAEAEMHHTDGSA